MVYLNFSLGLVIGGAIGLFIGLLLGAFITIILIKIGKEEPNI